MGGVLVQMGTDSENACRKEVNQSQNIPKKSWIERVVLRGSL